MHLRLALALIASSSLVGAPAHRAAAPRAAERIAINDNRVPAGTVSKGVRTVRLEVREGEWRPDGDAGSGIVVRAFAERGKRMQVPGPLLRVTEGTEIDAFVTNTLARGTLTVHNLSPRGVRGGADTMQIAAGATREARFVAGAPGTYYYWGTVDGAPQSDSTTRDAELSGAFVVDPRGAPPSANDRVLVIGLWSKSSLPGGLVTRSVPLRFTINGRSWPNTERLSYSIGDTVQLRVVNTSAAVHPMHLHGFYFDVMSRGDGVVDSTYDASVPPYRVVTERLAPKRTFTMRWVPERAGNWLFHCHDNYHVLRSAPLDGTALEAEQHVHVKNHAMEMMGGLVMGIEVRGRERAVASVPESSRRRLRLVAQRDSGGTEGEPAYRYALYDGASPSSASTQQPLNPTILLQRGQPVSITVVNQLPEATAVHWHGIELESYFDGVADFSGSRGHIAPAIAPGDSFEVRFTPPRAGTFMIHPHADELRQQQAGLAGVLLVVDDPAAFDATHDIPLLLTVPRRDADTPNAILVNGRIAPTTLALRVGERYRLRLVDVHTFRPSMITRVLRDSALVSWRPVAKDGIAIPEARAAVRPAMQQMGNGETYDFELAPERAGDLRITISSAAGLLLATVPVVVR
ncbi:MAG TPA: multicopper oxidase domain-containing protein [Gemmatimonadaceae bacterium]|nr:multicopper oxidase domain-containing protein [Gemmatimonadaceae bacterium]